jgi:hypothetical protein
MRIRHSGSDTDNPKLRDRTRGFKTKSNRQFFAAALKELAARGERRTGRMTICLVGQRDLPGVALRRAQAALRWDLRPSLWSHAFLIVDNVAPTVGAVARARVREVVLHAVTGATLAEYDDSEVDANVALLSVEMDRREAAAVAKRAMEQPNLDRNRYDLWQTLGIWQSYFWSGGAAANPLRESYPLFSSSFVEYCFEGIPLDLAPGASDRNSAPEHLWNAAKWWHKELAEFGHPIRGVCVLQDPHCTQLDPK